MNAVQSAARWCGGVALVVSVVALWRAESRATTPQHAVATPSIPVLSPTPIAPAAASVLAPPPAVLAAVRVVAPPVEPPAVQRNPRDFRVRRLVLTSEVRDHEPVDERATFSLADHEPIVAFVEMENGSGAPAPVLVRFERGNATRAAGEVQLEVPAQRRYRTWGFSRAVRSAGTWTAVVTTLGGRELAHQSFEVTS